MSLSRLLSADSNDHRRFTFFTEYERSRAAARVIGPLLRPFRLAIDFSDPKHCRLQERKLILTVRDAAQQNRLRQLMPRMKHALEREHMEVDEISIRLLPVPFHLPDLPSAPLVERRPTLEGAFSVARCRDLVKDPALKETLERLEAVLTPKKGFNEALNAQIARESERRSTQLAWVREQLSNRNELEHLRFLCPSSEDAARNPAFAPVRARMLAKMHILQTEETALRELSTRLEERFRELLRASVRLSEGEEPRTIAQDLYATSEVTELDRLYDGLFHDLRDQISDGR